MLKHILKLMWNKKTNHIFFFVEILVIFLIVTMTTLFTSSLMKKYFIDKGFDTKLQYIIQSDFGSIKDSIRIVETKARIEQEINQNPNIESSTWLSSSFPFSGNTWGKGSDVLGFYLHTLFVIAEVDVEQTLGLNIIQGRSFIEEDYNAKYTPVIVNKKFYDKYTETKGGMLDSIINFSGEIKVVGVMDHFKQNGQFEDEKYYFIALNHPKIIIDPRWMPDNLVVKTIPNPNPAFQSEISTIFSHEPTLGDIYISNFEESRIKRNAPYWAQLVLIGIISLFLLINISLGLIGILSHTINQRKGEIGLRKVMGATTSNIVYQFVGEVMLVAGLSIFVGGLFIVQLPYITELGLEKASLYQAAGISMLFIIILLFLSSIIPSLKGARLEPSAALHEEG